MEQGRGALRRRQVPALVLGCLAASLLTSWASLGTWFVGDDLGEIQRAHVGDHRGSHTRPAVTVLLRLNRAVHDLDPFGYHLLNVALHAVVIGLVGWLAATLARGAVPDPARRRAIGVAAGLTFAVLATHSEVVSWISARGDLVVAAGALVAVGSWLRRADAAWWGWCAVAGLLLALLSKEQAVVIPLLCAAAEWAVGGRRSLRRAVVALRDAWPLLGATALFVVVRGLVLGSFVGSYGSGDGFDWQPLRWPARFVVMAVRTVVPGSAPATWALLALLAVAAGAVGWAGRRTVAAALRRPESAPAATAALLAALALLPGIGLGVSVTDVRGDRLLYLASTFAAVAVALAGSALLAATPRPRRRAVLAGAAALLVLSAGAAVERDHRWAAAGDLAEATLGSGERWTRPRDVVVLNPADHLRGAYAHRNTLGDAAVVVHGWDAPGMVSGVAPMWVADPSATVEVRSLGQGRWLLTPEEGRAGFVVGPPQVHAPLGISARARRDGSLEVHVPAGTDLRDVWFVSEGRLLDLAAVAGAEVQDGS